MRQAKRPISSPGDDVFPPRKIQKIATRAPGEVMRPESNSEAVKGTRGLSFTEDEGTRPTKMPRTDTPTWNKELNKTYARYEAYLQEECREKAKQLRREIPKMRRDLKELDSILRRVQKEKEHLKRERVSWVTMRKLVLDWNVEGTSDLVKDGMAVLKKAGAERERIKVIEVDAPGMDDGASSIGDVGVDDEVRTEGGFMNEEGDTEDEIDGEGSTDEEVDAED